jgi:hypothetical protein
MPDTATMQIKPFNHPPAEGSARTALGTYEVRHRRRDGWYAVVVYWTDEHWQIVGFFETSFRAWAAASADYERRVRACLVDSPSRPADA